MKQNVYVPEILTTEFVANKGLNRNSALTDEESGETPCGVAKRVFRRVRRRTPHNATGLCPKGKRDTRDKKTDKQPIPDFVNVLPQNHLRTMV